MQKKKHQILVFVFPEKSSSSTHLVDSYCHIFSGCLLGIYDIYIYNIYIYILYMTSLGSNSHCRIDDYFHLLEFWVHPSWGSWFSCGLDTHPKNMVGGFLKWGNPKSGWFFLGKILLTWMMTGGTSISGKHHILESKSMEWFWPTTCPMPKVIDISNGYPLAIHIVVQIVVIQSTMFIIKPKAIAFNDGQWKGYILQLVHTINIYSTWL